MTTLTVNPYNDGQSNAAVRLAVAWDKGYVAGCADTYAVRDDLDALKATLALLVRDVERANGRAETAEFNLARVQEQLARAEAEAADLRKAWTTSRHFKALRAYGDRARAAENKATSLQDRLDNIRELLS